MNASFAFLSFLSFLSRTGQGCRSVIRGRRANKDNSNSLRRNLGGQRAKKGRAEKRLYSQPRPSIYSSCTVIFRPSCLFCLWISPGTGPVTCAPHTFRLTYVVEGGGFAFVSQRPAFQSCSAERRPRGPRD